MTYNIVYVMHLIKARKDLFMETLTLENPDNLWVRLDNGVYTTPVFVEGTPNPLFNSLPNSPYLTNGETLQYMGFLEGYNGVTKFSSEMLFVVLYGSCSTDKSHTLVSRNAIFSKEITCSKGSIVLVFMPKPIDAQIEPLVQSIEEVTQNEYVTKYRIWGEKLGNNMFFQAWSGANYTFHAFTQISQKNVARGAHAAGFYRKNLVLHKGSISMKTYFPENSVVVELTINKTPFYYEGYYLSGFAYHSFKANDDTIDTIFVERNYGIPMEIFPLKALFTEPIICGKRDGQIPTKEQVERIRNSTIIKLNE